VSSFIKIIFSITIILVSLMIKGKSSPVYLHNVYSLDVEDELYEYINNEIIEMSYFSDETDRLLVAFIGTNSCPATLHNLYDYHQISESFRDLIVFIDSESREAAYNYFDKSDLTNLPFMHNEFGFYINSQIMNRIFIVDFKNNSGISNIILYSNIIDSIDKKKNYISDLESFYK